MHVPSKPARESLSKSAARDSPKRRWHGSIPCTSPCPAVELIIWAATIKRGPRTRPVSIALRSSIVGHSGFSAISYLVEDVHNLPAQTSRATAVERSPAAVFPQETSIVNEGPA